jgi:hypothetical protein
MNHDLPRLRGASSAEELACGAGEMPAGVELGYPELEPLLLGPVEDRTHELRGVGQVECPSSKATDLGLHGLLHDLTSASSMPAVLDGLDGLR